MAISFKVLLDHEFAKAPHRANEDDSGYDLFSCEDVIISPGERYLVDTGIKMRFPKSICGRICPKSVLALKHGIDIMAGVIDSSFKERVKVLLFNTSDQHFHIVVGDRIAQIVLQSIKTPKVEVVSSL